ncbi:hypothetical protein D8674_019375 [Pyrus ussuriensis x Pyrus communis]|uniref:Uncharacterized protein n=1 Tax=Pyrus ussuriensis x Pyrus communis TaxID=2448454 RepID=A0A5N5G7L5_9ROSA|nr:hypothetical protein D8674_019375 [Pyrus ussuriensis x Pyrus communis]
MPPKGNGELPARGEKKVNFEIDIEVSSMSEYTNRVKERSEKGSFFTKVDVWGDTHANYGNQVADDIFVLRGHAPTRRISMPIRQAREKDAHEREEEFMWYIAVMTQGM